MDKKPNAKKSRLRKHLQSAMYRRSPHMRLIYLCSLVAAVILAAATLVMMHLVVQTQQQADHMNEAYQTCQQAVDTLQETSDFLTNESRQYVITGERQHLDAYVNELEQLDRRGQSLEVLRREAMSVEAVNALEEARRNSDELAHVELYALRLGAQSFNVRDLPDLIQSVTLEDADANLSVNEQRRRAYELLHGNEYLESKFSIRDNVDDCSELLVQTLRRDLDSVNRKLASLIFFIHIGIMLLLLVVFLVIASSVVLLLWPMSIYGGNIRDNAPLVPAGSKELRYLVDAYNDMYEKNVDRTELLSFEARNDALTGLLNRGSFNNLLTQHKESSALILVDVDYFKQFNDEYGHEMGDAILVEVAATLYASFRSSDYVCRIGGDEFAVIMTNADTSMRDLVDHKIQKLAAFLRDTQNGLPAASVSVGVAFGSPGCTDDGLFQEADKALYHTKESGRDGCTFASEL